MIAIWLKTLSDGFWFDEDFLDSLGKNDVDRSPITINNNKALFDNRQSFLDWLENHWQKFSAKIVGFEFAYQGKLPSGRLQYVFMSEKFNFAEWRANRGYVPKKLKAQSIPRKPSFDGLFGELPVEPSEKDLMEIESLIETSTSQEDLVNNLVGDKQRKRLSKGNNSLTSTKKLMAKGKIKSPGRPRKRKTSK